MVGPTHSFSHSANNRRHSIKPRSLAGFGSGIGGIPETQEMLDYCAKHNIVTDIELIPIQKNQRSLRTHSQEQRQIPLHDRHAILEGVT
jgi:D-arabinose 1-dehydrogenase-like Zn-dependent alcohol dehydrogenase